MNDTTLGKIRKFESYIGAKVIAYYAAFPVGKTIAEEDAQILLECLGSECAGKRLALILNSDGGNITAAYRLAHLVRQKDKRFRVFIPHRARSAATILALASRSIILGPLGDMGPIDAHILGSSPSADSATPVKISTEDLKAFLNMARQWFAADLKRDGVQLLAILLQRLFPTALSSLYMADQYVRTVAAELLECHLPRAGSMKRRRIIDALVSGYQSHSHSFSLERLKSLGLNVRRTNAVEEEALDEISKFAHSFMQRSIIRQDSARRSAIIFSTSYLAYYSGLNAEVDRFESKLVRIEKGGPSHLPQSRWVVIKGRKAKER